MENKLELRVIGRTDKKRWIVENKLGLRVMLCTNKKGSEGRGMGEKEE